MPKKLTDLERQRNALALATREGRTADAQIIRQELAVGTLLRDVHKRLDGLTLTKEQADRLIGAILAYRSRDEMEAEALEKAAQVTQLVALLRERLAAGDGAQDALQGANKQVALVTATT